MGGASGGKRLVGLGSSALLVALAVVLAIAGGMGGADDGEEMSPHFVSSSELSAIEDALGHSVYWAGERPPEQIGLKQEPDGSVYLRYLPRGVSAGDRRVTFLTVGTYPVVDAQAAVRRAAVEAGARVEGVASGGIVLANPASEGSVYLAYPDSDLEIEVYDPVPGRAMGLIRSGAIRPAGEG